MRRNRLFSLLALGVGAGLACAAGEPGPGTPIEPAELAARIAAGEAPPVLDVRTADEYAAGHVPGAIHVPHDELAERLPELGLAADAELVVHCEAGGRAAAAEALLRDAGYTQVRDLSGHMRRWRAEGLPLD